MGEGEFLNSLLLGMFTVAQKENSPLQGCGSVVPITSIFVFSLCR